MPSAIPTPGTKINKWGYSFTWTEDHFPREHTDPLQFESDKLGDAALASIQAKQAEIAEKCKAQGITSPDQDLYVTLHDHHDEDEAMKQFWEEEHTVPDWVDWEQLERGQKFFCRYALPNMVGFGLQGFVAENSASVRVVEVLVRTGGFSTMKLLERLLETFQWLVRVTDNLPDLMPGGNAHIATVRVRLLHASVRQRMRKLATLHPKYYDMDKFGVPVNTLDSIHSISTFSCSQMWMQLPRLGITPRWQEKEDYVALLRYIAYLLGTPHSYFDDTEKAKKLMESLYVHELEVTETSHTVAYNFMQCVTNLPFPFYVSRSFIEAGSRWINGNDLCDQLGLGNPGYFYYIVFAGQCLLSIELAWAQRLVPYFDNLIVKLFRTIMFQGLVEQRGRSHFEFKWVPELGKQTGKEDHQPDYSVKPTILERAQMLLTMGPIELLFLSVIVMHGYLAYSLGGYVVSQLWKFEI